MPNYSLQSHKREQHKEGITPNSDLKDMPKSPALLRVKLPLPIIHIAASLLIALLAGILLLSNALIGGIVSTIINIGLDPLRAQFIAALIMTAGAALVSAVLLRHKLGAFLGAGLAFCYSYLFDFIRLELQPFRDPGGLLEPLNSWALVRTSFLMVALALLGAFIGAAVGASLGQILLDPPYRLVRYAWRRFLYYRETPALALASQLKSTTAAHRTASIIGNWLAAGSMIVLLVLASGSGDLFLFSPDVGLHTVPQVHTSTTTPGVSSIVQDSIVSKALGGQRKPFQVYLPPSYNTPIGKTRYYPTLYLLHGSPGKDIDWLVGGKANESADTLIASGKIPELIMVFPDGNGRPGATSEWGNSFDQRQLIETYVVNDLVKYVDQHYRTLPDPAHRAIGGLSMGGFGAMNIAIHHPNVFGSVISLGGYYYAEGAIWGKNARYMEQNSPADTIPSNRAAWKLHIFLGAASKDQPYYNDTKQFMQILNRLHVPSTFELENGYHAWTVWQAQLYKALIWLQWG